MAKAETPTPLGEAGLGAAAGFSNIPLWAATPVATGGVAGLAGTGGGGLAPLREVGEKGEVGF